jgi:hypothetical protein
MGETSSGNIVILQDVDTYFDFLVFSVAGHWYYGIMILQPSIGVGLFSTIQWSFPSPMLPIGVGLGFMFKIDDDDW